jgi:hypothetical protein
MGAAAAATRIWTGSNAAGVGTAMSKWIANIDAAPGIAKSSRKSRRCSRVL